MAVLFVWLVHGDKRKKLSSLTAFVCFVGAENWHRYARLSLPLAVGALASRFFGKKLLRFDFYAVHRILIQQAPPLQLLQQPREEVACNLFRGAQAVIEIYFYKGGVGEDFRYDKINEKSSHY